jgi:hypothetical protein
MTRKIRPFTLLFSHHVALTCLFGLLVELAALSSTVVAQNPVPLECAIRALATRLQ